MRFRGALSAGLFFLSMSFLAPLPSLADTTEKAAKETEKQKMEMEREAQKQRHRMERQAQKDRHALEREEHKQKG